MAIGAPRWGGLRPDPYNPDSPDADNDGIVQEGTLSSVRQVRDC